MAPLAKQIRNRVPDGMKHGVRAARARWGGATTFFRVLPDFLIIGAQRSGTTSLYKYLVEHPGVVAPPLGKGAHFFDTNFHKGEDWYRRHFPTRLAHERRAGRLTGEASPYYLFHPCAPGRAAATVPGASLVVMLRDPVSRAHSHYWHEVARGFETLSFEEALDREPERLAGEEERLKTQPSYRSVSHQHWSYVARGLYAEQLERWYEHFPTEQILVLRSEDFFEDADGGYHAVLEFLGLPARRLRGYDAFNPREYEPMTPALERRLADRFSEPNARLFELLGRDFCWRA